MFVLLCLAHLAPVGIGIEAEVMDGDLTLVGNMGCDPGDELQIIHALHLGGLFPIPVADLTFPFIEGEAGWAEEPNSLKPWLPWIEKGRLSELAPYRRDGWEGKEILNKPIFIN